MSWIDEIKLARWLNNGVAKAQTFGVNLIGKAGVAVDNPTYLTTLPDGSVATGRTEITFYDPNQPLIWTVIGAPATAAERFISNYGSYFTANTHGKFCRRGFTLNAISWTSQGFTPAESITLKLYINSAAVGATWQMVIPAAFGPNGQQTLRPSTPLVVANGSLIGISLTQAGVSGSPTMNAVIAIT